MVKGRATYLFALLRRARPPALAHGPLGLPGGGPPRLLSVRPGLWLVAADAPLDRYGAAAIERGLTDMAWVSACALAHERVVEHFADAGALLPMKLFTLFVSDERAVRHVRSRLSRLLRALDEVAGRQEWGVRLRGSGRPARSPKAVGKPAKTSGTLFLLAKKAERDRDGQRTERAAREADGLYRSLADHADRSRRRPPLAEAARSGLWLDAAFLVPRHRRRVFESAVRRQAARLRPQGYEVTLTGPWPPYNFSEPA